MSWEAWCALPWWEQRLLHEGLADELSATEPGEPQTERTVFSGQPGEFARAGFNETTLRR